MYHHQLSELNMNTKMYITCTCSSACNVLIVNFSCSLCQADKERVKISIYGGLSLKGEVLVSVHFLVLADLYGK